MADTNGNNTKEPLEQRIKPLLMKVDTNIKIDDVILSDENKSKLKQFLRENDQYDRLMRYGFAPMNRLLFYGDSGTGKTFLGKALSNYLHYRMLYVDISQSLANNEVADNLHTIFEYANLKEECLVFLDECDSIAWNRDAKSAEGGQIRRATNSLFQSIDQMKPNVVLIAATNMLHRLDPAFERRFNMKFEFRRPNDGLLQYIKRFMRDDFTLIEDVNDPVIEKRANGKMSFFEIEGLVYRAMKRSVLNGTTDVRLSELYNDIAPILKIKRKFRTDEREDETPEPSGVSDDMNIDL